jgi:hypothetical protein
VQIGRASPYMDNLYDIKNVQYFPPPVARLKPNWFDALPRDLRKLLSEIYRSLDADTRALPMMGARAVLDRVIVDTIGDVGSFEQKLKKLEEERHINAKGREILDAALDAGNAAIHRGHAPTVKDVHSVMDIVEHLLHSTYVLESVAEEIKRNTPPRSPQKKRPITRSLVLSGSRYIRRIACPRRAWRVSRSASRHTLVRILATRPRTTVPKATKLCEHLQLSFDRRQYHDSLYCRHHLGMPHPLGTEASHQRWRT